MKPLFQVGEEVVLQSKTHPELNGECTVMQVQKNGDKYLNPDKNRIVTAIYRYGHFSYFTSIRNPNGEPWAQCALRKKHKPSDQSLEDIIKEINSKVKS